MPRPRTKVAARPTPPEVAKAVQEGMVVTETGPSLLPPWPIFRTLAEVAQEMQLEAYIIGGFVRDRLMKREGKPDIDIMVLGKGIEFAKAVSARLNPGPKVTVFKTFGTAHFHFRGKEFEFVGARKESYSPDSRNPTVESGTLEDDQRRRDFTINAMAVQLWPEFGKLIDPFEGQADLNKRVIKTPLDPAQTFSDDPLRMLRAIRFAAQLDFNIHPETLKCIKAEAGRLSILTQERITEELNKMILAPVPSVAFKLLFETGLLQAILPELVALHGVEHQEGKGHKDNFWHTLQVLDGVAENTDDLYIRWSAILHDIAKPATKRYEPGHGWTFHGHEELGARMVYGIFKRLRLPLHAERKRVERLVRLHLRPISLTKEIVTDSAVRRLVLEAGEDLESLMILCRADITSKNAEKKRRYLLRFDEVESKIEDLKARDFVRTWQPPVSGEEIMELFNLSPSKNVGILKDSLKEAMLEGEIEHTREAALAFLEAKAIALGLR